MELYSDIKANEKNNGANNDNDEAMPIFESDGQCINPYLDVFVGSRASSSRTFNFDAFAFDSNLAADTITIVSPKITLNFGNWK